MKIAMKPQLPIRQAIIDRRTYEPPGEGRADKLRLDFNENTAGCSPAVRRALGETAHRSFSRCIPNTIAALGVSRDIFEWRPKNSFSPTAAMTLCDFSSTRSSMPGTSVVICEPTFPMYRYWGEVAGAKIEVQRYGPTMEFPLEGVLQGCSLCARASCFSATRTIQLARSSTNPSSKQF